LEGKKKDLKARKKKGEGNGESPKEGPADNRIQNLRWCNHITLRPSVGQEPESEKKKTTNILSKSRSFAR